MEVVFPQSIGSCWVLYNGFNVKMTQTQKLFGGRFSMTKDIPSYLNVLELKGLSKRGAKTIPELFMIEAPFSDRFLCLDCRWSKGESG